jgi:RNA polymerase sigma-70 factor (ECF subfamily)
MRHSKALVNLSKPLYNHIRNIILNHDDTNDVLQNTFIKIFQKKIQRRKQTVLGCIALRQMKLLTFKKKKAKSKSHLKRYKNKAIDNLKSDSYFDGNEIK